MKKIIALFLCLISAVSTLVGCSVNVKDKTDFGKLKIVTTIFPIYDWVKNIAGDKADVSMLLSNGVDIHSFQPSAQDIVKISNCDMFIYVGGESDSWVEDALNEKINKNLIAVNLMDVLKKDIKREELKDGMQSEESADCEIEYDEHIWLSLRNAENACTHICGKLSELDSKGRKAYEKNTEEYKRKLSELDKKFIDAVKKSKTKTMVFGDRFPLRYFIEDYKLNYYAAFVGCSAETEASFKTIAFLAGKVDEYKLNAIYKIETSDGKIAETIKNNTKTKNQKILTFDSMQSINSNDVKNKTTYIKIMEKNLDVVKKGIQ